MVGLGQSLKELGGNDMGRVPWALCGQVFPDVCSTMTVLEYLAKSTELARFTDDYVATDMAKVRKFEDDLKLSIRGRIL